MTDGKYQECSELTFNVVLANNSTPEMSVNVSFES